MSTQAPPKLPPGRCKPPTVANPLEFKLSHCLDRHGVLDLRQHPRADEDLTGFGLIAKARGDIGNRPDGGVIEASQPLTESKKS